MYTKLAERQILSSNFAIAHRQLLCSEQLFPHFLKKLEVELRKIDT